MQYHYIISIHALLAESDSPVSHDKYLTLIFLSTLSLRRATLTKKENKMHRLYFYPRSPCGERRIGLGTNYKPADFYPRSPCGERPSNCFTSSPVSTISIHALLAESDTGDSVLRIFTNISIHALLAESDWLSSLTVFLMRNFYPRSPCGERPSGFSSFESPIIISIHALLAESDVV